MARVDIPLPGKDKDYDSRKSRAKLVNLMVDLNIDGSFRSINKREGLRLLGPTTNGDDIISNFLRVSLPSGPSIYFCGTTNLYSISATGAIVDLGAHGLTAATSVEVSANTAIPVEILFLNNSTPGDAVIYRTGFANTLITDVSFTGKNPTSVDYVNNRFVFADTLNSPEFFISAPNDGFTYDPLAFAAADEENGRIVATLSYKSGIRVFTTNHTEFWQADSDVLFPFRRIQGASWRIGAASLPIKLHETISFLGSDYKVYMANGSEYKAVSDIDFSNIVQSDEGIAPKNFFIDGVNHQYYTFTSHVYGFAGFADFTWAYDLKTGQSHYRTSPGRDFWNVGAAEFLEFRNTQDVYVSRFYDGDPANDTENVYTLSPNNYADEEGDFDCILQSGSVSFDHDSTIEFIEIEMETGVGNVDSPNPVMSVEYSKDGGVNFTTWGTVPLGAAGDNSKRVKMNGFGRLVRHTDFVLKLTITEPVRVVFYGAYAEITGGF